MKQPGLFGLGSKLACYAIVSGSAPRVIYGCLCPERRCRNPMSPKPKDDREEPEESGADEAATEGTDANKTAAAAYGRRTITKSGKFPKTPSSSSGKSRDDVVDLRSSSPAISIREEGKLMGSSGTSRYTLVAPRTGKKKKADPPAE